jgi:hypothetical protein
VVQNEKRTHTHKHTNIFDSKTVVDRGGWLPVVVLHVQSKSLNRLGKGEIAYGFGDGTESAYGFRWTPAAA